MNNIIYIYIYKVKFIYMDKKSLIILLDYMNEVHDKKLIDINIKYKLLFYILIYTIYVKLYI